MKQANNQIWFKKPAVCWEEVHPIGNGSLGAMIWGTTSEELLGLNLDTLWSGVKRDTNNYEAYSYLAPVREEIFAGHYKKAAEMTEEHLLGEFGENYLPMGNLCIRVGTEDSCEAYRRVLDLDEGTETVSYIQNGCHFTREYFASYPDRLIGIQYTSGKPQNYAIRFTSELRPVISAIVDAAGKETVKRQTIKGIRMQGQCPEHVEPSYLDSSDPVIWGDQGIRFQTELRILHTDGIVEWKEETKELLLTNATVFEVALVAVSGDREEPLKIPEIPEIQKTYRELKSAHQADYQALFLKVGLWLGDADEIPTDERLKRLAEGSEDPALFALFFQYGRYLLISSSREGTEAANLQGIWNWEMRAPWSANYTTNINVEMNYWPALVCGLSECMEPYVRLLSELSVEGKKTAQVHFGCRGFCVGHNTDYWRLTNPVGVPYGKKGGVKGSSLYAFFVLSGQWMCETLWRMYEYQKDADFLEKTVYPILKDAALFAVDWLVEYEGQYVTCPSASPENQFRTKEGVSPISMGCTMDMTIIREIFDEFELAYRELERLGRNKQMQITKKTACSSHKTEERDTDVTGERLLSMIKERHAKLLPYQIGEDGRLLEWIYPFEETEPGHRHISHAYGLFPGGEFRKDEELKEACKKSIEYRLSHGGGHTGWSCAWIANLFAVLGDGEKAYQYMNTLLTQSICPNLWTSHPPFQIDANFAGTMAMAQMFVQELDGAVMVLPAIPAEWKCGQVKGLRLTDNRAIDIAWENGTVTWHITDKNGKIRTKNGRLP